MASLWFHVRHTVPLFLSLAGFDLLSCHGQRIVWNDLDLEANLRVVADND